MFVLHVRVYNPRQDKWKAARINGETIGQYIRDCLVINDVPSTHKTEISAHEVDGKQWTRYTLTGDNTVFLQIFTTEAL